jgi:hypothetical protein
VGSPSPPPPPKRVRAVLTGLVSFAMYFRFFFPGSSSLRVSMVIHLKGLEVPTTPVLHQLPRPRNHRRPMISTRPYPGEMR